MGTLIFRIRRFLILFSFTCTIFGLSFLNALPVNAQSAKNIQVTDEVNDPLEPVNRVMFKFNGFFQDIVLRPLADVYTLVIPDQGRKAVHNFLGNMKSPLILAIDLLHGEGDRAWVTTKRFVINTTIGVGGIFDVADKWGIKHHSEDAGQTLAVWGVPDGFYLVLPILGPSNPRDALGKVIEIMGDPASHWLRKTDSVWSTSRMVVGGVDEFAGVKNELKKLEENSIDYYAAIRSISRQKRRAEISNLKSGDAILPNFTVQVGDPINFEILSK